MNISPSFFHYFFLNISKTALCYLLLIKLPLPSSWAFPEFLRSEAVSLWVSAPRNESLSSSIPPWLFVSISMLQKHCQPACADITACAARVLDWLQHISAYFPFPKHRNSPKPGFTPCVILNWNLPMYCMVSSEYYSFYSDIFLFFFFQFSVIPSIFLIKRGILSAFLCVAV